jgi:hypothetical protein
MAELPDEAKQRIEQEERYREQVRRKLATKPRRRGWPWWVNVLALIALFVACSSLVKPPSTASTAKPQPTKAQLYGIDPYDMQTRCENTVKAGLKAPATAKWPGIFDRRDVYQTKTESVWKSYVDSQNSFGALIRTQFECVYTRKTNSLKVTVMSP